MENLVRKKMSESKDPKIKLFGQTIQLPENPPPPSTAVDGGGSDAISDHSTAQDLPCSTNSSPEETSLGKSCEELESKKEILNQTLSKDKTKQESELAKKPEEQCEGEKTLKKPDKIIPCPRCNSMETKFCYFNNYNVSQPRHFCKKCQRYWTAGGTMRNVPVGAGRRKNKNIPITPQYRPLLVTETLPNGTHRCIPNNNGNVLTFGEEVDQDQDQSSGSSVTAVNSVEEVKVDPVVPHYPNFPPCFNNGPWAYPVPVMPPGFYPIPFYAPPPPPPYWGCNLAGAWNINPWNIPSKSPVSPILGKRSRDDEGGPGPGPEPKPEKSIWVPKTLRIDDPGEAARSSIWETLGIKYDKGGDPVGRGNSLFKPFRSKKDETTPTSETTSSSVLQANPAALSRSLNFQENA